MNTKDTWSFHISPVGWILLAVAFVLMVYGYCAGANLDDTQQRSPLTSQPVSVTVEEP